MIYPSTVSCIAKKYIMQKLKTFEKLHNVRIILAIESGSRAWGFPSSDSDYDVRFIYIRHPHDYLSISPQRDVLETDIIHDTQLGVPFDLNGWDARKALQLALKSNPVLIEWLQSPILYIKNEILVTDLMQYTQKTADLEHIKKHYYKLMNVVWENIKKQKTVKIKHYCYALRPALAFKWINNHNSLAPMDIFSLYTGLKSYINFEHDLAKLITLKATTKELDTIARNEKIDAFIESIACLSVDQSYKTTNEIYRTEGDQLFRNMLKVK